MITPNNSVAETDVVAMPGMVESNQEIASFLRENGVSVRFFQGSHNLDGFSIITGNIPYVAINTRRSLATQRYVAQRELGYKRATVFDNRWRRCEKVLFELGNPNQKSPSLETY